MKEVIESIYFGFNLWCCYHAAKILCCYAADDFDSDHLKICALHQLNICERAFHSAGQHLVALMLEVQRNQFWISMEVKSTVTVVM